MTNQRYKEQKGEYERQHRECEHDWEIVGNYETLGGATVTQYICIRCGKESDEKSW